MDVKDLMRQLRGDLTQQQFAPEIGVVRETVSKYETGRAKVPADISRTLIEKFDDARFALTIKREYTGTGPVWLNGENVDLHRSSVREKTLEEIQEVLEAISKFSMANPLQAIKSFELPVLEQMLQEAADAITALEHFIAIVCQETNISYKSVWEKHYTKLKRAGYIQS